MAIESLVLQPKRFMKRRLRKLLLFGTSIYLGIIVLLVALESALIYPAPPATDGDWNPSWLDFEEVNLVATDGTRVHGWFLEHPDPQAVVLLCHGNGEHVAYLAEELDLVRRQFQACVMAFDYRGYGKSEGKPFEDGILTDAEAAHVWLATRTDITPDSIVLWGRSLGGAVAVHLAARYGARGMILDRTFSSMVDVASSHYPWLPVRWMLRNRYPSVDRIRAYDGPLLQVHGQIDEVIPFQFGRKLFDAAPSVDKQFLVSETMTHNSRWPEHFYPALVDFINSLPHRSLPSLGQP